MTPLALSPTRLDFAPLHAAMKEIVDGELLAGVSSAVLQGRNLIDLHCTGWADREQQIALRPDHIFRMYSSTKLITSCAVLLLMEDGKLGLDDPIERFIAQLGKRQVLRPGATSLGDTEPARSPITVRHLLTHSAGLGYGLLDPGTLLYQAFIDAGVRDHTTTLAHMIDLLEGLALFAGGDVHLRRGARQDAVAFRLAALRRIEPPRHAAQLFLDAPPCVARFGLAAVHPRQHFLGVAAAGGRLRQAPAIQRCATFRRCFAFIAQIGKAAQNAPCQPFTDRKALPSRGRARSLPRLGRDAGNIPWEFCAHIDSSGPTCPQGA